MENKTDLISNGFSTTPEDEGEASVRRALSYHERTKHHPQRYARSLGYLDWATQPDPFRTFASAPVIDLPISADGLDTSYAKLYIPGAVAPRPLDLAAIGILFELALGLSAWKQFNNTRWALRCNPSSGNLHPTEGYAILPALPQIAAGVYHYVSRDHCLEQRCALDDADSVHFAEALPPGGFIVCLSSIHWREAWKYGERAFRYCQHDLGHAIATVRYAAASLGWTARLMGELSDSNLAALLGLDRDSDFAAAKEDREHPGAALIVAPHGVDQLDTQTILAQIARGKWNGLGNALSPDHVDWEVIDDVAQATWKPTTGHHAVELPALPALLPTSSAPASTLIRQRRSCLALDGQTAIAAETFYTMLDALLPRPGVAPWDALPWEPQLHAGLFVHRISGLPAGLYFLERSQHVHPRLRAAMQSQFHWARPPHCPDHLRLFCLAEGDFRDVSRAVSCGQDIASDGVFSLGMIADFGDAVRRRGAWWYRRLFWESGVLGQVLYLQAEAAGIRSTGIGCYFDDPFHTLLGLAGDQFQSLYHFTVGGPVEDPRLITLAPYAHVRGRGSGVRDQGSVRQNSSSKNVSSALD
ncbi:MAG: SagB/ThcOx family dehydrogenase [Acidobacteriota bacterium]